MIDKMESFPKRDEDFPRKLQNIRRRVEELIMRPEEGRSLDGKKLVMFEQAVATYSEEQLRDAISTINLNTINTEHELCMALLKEYDKRALGLGA